MKDYDQLFQSKETVEKPFKKASAALSFIEQSHENQKLPVGLLYQDPSAQDFHVYANTAKPALREVLFEDLCPGADLLKQLNEQLR